MDASLIRTIAARSGIQCKYASRLRNRTASVANVTAEVTAMPNGPRSKWPNKSKTRSAVADVKTAKSHGKGASAPVLVRVSADACLKEVEQKYMGNLAVG